MRHQRNDDRYEHLHMLAQEYKAPSTALEAKRQVLANLANFAYNPINYPWLWQLSVIDLFLEAISGTDRFLKEFGMGGMANLSLDPPHRNYLLSDPQHARAIVDCLCDRANTHDTFLNAMTTLMYLIDEDNRDNIMTPMITARLQELSSDPRQHAMATLFLSNRGLLGFTKISTQLQETPHSL